MVRQNNILLKEWIIIDLISIILFSTHVAEHFNLPEHTIDNVSFVPFDIVHGDFNRLCKETYWIHKFDTMYPKGLNAKVLYNL